MSNVFGKNHYTSEQFYTSTSWLDTVFYVNKLLVINMMSDLKVLVTIHFFSPKIFSSKFSFWYRLKGPIQHIMQVKFEKQKMFHSSRRVKYVPKKIEKVVTTFNIYVVFYGTLKFIFLLLVLELQVRCNSNFGI